VTLSLNPFDFEALYDVLVAEGIASPGNVVLTGLAREYGWDEKPADGEDGASLEAKGGPLAKFSATFELTLDPVQGVDDFAYWDDTFVPVLQRSVADPDNPQAIELYHPDLVRLGITRVVVKKIGQLIHDKKGGATVTVDFWEYKPPRPKGGAPKPKGADPNADVKAEIEALLDEAKKP
jgi:hypothetical protein